MTIRVVHILRPDHEARFGGDIVHLRANVEALQERGLDATVATWEDAPSVADVVHLYNLDLPFDLRVYVRQARRRWPGVKVVLSPLFWPWPFGTVVRSHDVAIWHRASRSAAKAWLTWAPVRRALLSLDAVVACSRRELDLLAHYYRISDTASWTAAPNAVWVRDWPLRTRSPDRAALAAELGLARVPGHVVACVGRLEPLKNQRALVRALADVPDSALVLIGAMGDRRYGSSVVALGEQLLPGRFAWTGRVPRLDVHRLLAEVDVHALVSFREVASLSSLEAAAAGCEVVVTSWSSTNEYYGDDAHFCRADEPASIAAAIDRACTTPRQPSLRRRIEDCFDWSESGRILVACYDRLLRRDW